MLETGRVALHDTAEALRSVYEDNTLPLAWDRVRRLGAESVGVVLDIFHVCARGRDAADLDGIPAEKIFQVQLNDLIEPVSTGSR